MTELGLVQTKRKHVVETGYPRSLFSLQKWLVEEAMGVFLLFFSPSHILNTPQASGMPALI
jgi:hypothetical protein